jgi:streptothricin hydrolase
VVHIQNDGAAGEPDEAGSPGWELALEPGPGEPVLRKTESDAFANPALAKSLAVQGVRRLIVAGMLSNYCVRSTCRGAIRQGLQVVLACGAHATYDEPGTSGTLISAAVEQELSREGVRVVPATDIDFSDV